VSDGPRKDCSHCGERWWVQKSGKDGAVLCMDSVPCIDRRDRLDAARREGRIEGLEWVAAQLRKVGATLPAPEPAGTIESAMVTSACCTLAMVEVEIEKLKGES